MLCFIGQRFKISSLRHDFVLQQYYFKQYACIVCISLIEIELTDPRIKEKH